MEMAEDDTCTFIPPAPDSDDPEADGGMAYCNEVAGTSAPTGKTIRDNIANGVEKVLCEGLPQDMQEKLGQKYLVPSVIAADWGSYLAIVKFLKTQMPRPKLEIHPSKVYKSTS